MERACWDNALFSRASCAIVPGAFLSETGLQVAHRFLGPLGEAGRRDDSHLFSCAPRYYSSGVDRGARLLYLWLQPWFSLPAALPEPANDRISRTYPVAVLSFSVRLSLSLFLSLSVVTYLSPSLCLFLALCPSFTLLSLSLNKLHSSTRFPLIRVQVASC